MYDVFNEELYIKTNSANADILKITKDSTNFIWFHYLLIHRILPTQKYLYYMKKQIALFASFFMKKKTHSYMHSLNVKV